MLNGTEIASSQYYRLFNNPLYGELETLDSAINKRHLCGQEMPVFGKPLTDRAVAECTPTASYSSIQANSKSSLDTHDARPSNTLVIPIEPTADYAQDSSDIYKEQYCRYMMLLTFITLELNDQTTCSEKDTADLKLKFECSKAQIKNLQAYKVIAQLEELSLSPIQTPRKNKIYNNLKPQLQAIYNYARVLIMLKNTESIKMLIYFLNIKSFTSISSKDSKELAALACTYTKEKYALKEALQVVTDHKKKSVIQKAYNYLIAMKPKPASHWLAITLFSTTAHATSKGIQCTSSIENKEHFRNTASCRNVVTPGCMLIATIIAFIILMIYNRGKVR